MTEISEKEVAMSDTHAASEPHEPQDDTSDHGHDTVSDAPIARPDGTMPPTNQRPLALGIGIAGAVLLLLVVAGVILYMNRNGNTAEAPAASNAGGAAPEAILTNASLRGSGDIAALAKGNVALGLLQPGTFRQQSGVVKSLSPNGEQHVSIKAATSATKTPTPSASKATATPTKAAQTTSWQDSDGRFGVRLPSGWTADDSQKDDFFIVEFVGPDTQGGPWVDVYSEDAGDATLDDLIAFDQKNEASSQKFTYKDGTVTDTTVGGEPAKTYTYSYVSKTKPNATPWTGQKWEVIHNGARWLIAASAIGSHKTDVSSLISSFSYSDSNNNNNGNGETTTFTDPNGLITLTYPSAWTPGQVDGDDANVLYIKSPAGSSLSLDISDQSGTPADELKIVKDNRSASTGFKYTFGNIVELKIGGEPAKMMPWTWANKQNSSAKGAGRDYIVNHGGKWFGFTTLAPTTDAFADLETIITSSSFGGSGNGNNTGGNTTTWTDPDKTTQMQIPNGWTASVDTSYDGNLVTLESPNGEVFYIDLLNPFDSLDTIMGNIKANHAKSDKYTYKDGDVKDVTVGGEPAKVLSYTYQKKGTAGAPTYQAKIWIFNHGGKGYYASGSPLDQAGPTVDAIVASIKFLS